MEVKKMADVKLSNTDIDNPFEWYVICGQLYVKFLYATCRTNSNYFKCWGATHKEKSHKFKLKKGKIFINKKV